MAFKSRQTQKAANVWTARIIPILLFGIIGYSSWAFTKTLAVDYLVHPTTSDSAKPRSNVAAAIIAVYYTLLFTVLVSYGRLLQTIFLNPGLVPRGAGYYRKQGDPEKSRHGHRHRGNSVSSTSRGSGDVPPLSRSQQQVVEAGLEDWYSKDVFVCQFDGFPAWCSTCHNFKPDRGHHCSEIQRCVKKMDHFCPWVGGIVSETSLKFFIQFVSYTGIFCAYVLIVTAIFVAERKHETGHVNIHWVLTLAFASLFFSFGAGMSLSTLQLAYKNLTTIENLSKTTSVWYLAVHIPRPDLLPQNNNPNSPPLFRTITFPLQRNASDSRPSGESQATTLTPSTPPRTFAILESRRGENPFDLGPLRNLQQVMGYTFLDWMLPFKHSPCTDHSNGESAYLLGPTVARMRKESGLTEYEPNEGKTTHKKRRKRRFTELELEEKDRLNEKRRRRHRRKHRHGSIRDKDSDLEGRGDGRPSSGVLR